MWQKSNSGLVYRAVLILLGVAIWWQLMSTASDLLAWRSVCLVDQDHLLSMRFSLPPIGKEKIWLELHDSRGNLISTRVQAGTLHTLRTRGQSAKGEVAIFGTQANGATTLSLLDPMTLDSRISRTLPVPSHGYWSTFTRDGKALIFADTDNDGVLHLYMLSTDDLAIIDKHSVPDDTYVYLAPSFSIGNDEILWHDKGSFRAEPRNLTNPDLEDVVSVSLDALLLESVAPPNDDDPGKVRYALYWPATGKRVELPHSELVQPQLTDGGDLILNDDKETTQRVASNQQGEIVSRLPPEPEFLHFPTKNLFWESLNEHPFDGCLDRLSIWNAQTGELASTTDFTKTARVRFIVVVALGAAWCFAWLLPLGKHRLRFLSYGICVAMICSILQAIAFANIFRNGQLAAVCLGVAQLTLVAFVGGWLVVSRDTIFRRTVEAFAIFALTFHSFAQYDFSFSAHTKYALAFPIVGCWAFLAIVQFSIELVPTNLLRDASPTRHRFFPRIRISDLMLLIAATALSIPWLSGLSTFASEEFWSSQREVQNFLGETTLLFVQASVALLVVFGSKWHRVLGASIMMLIVVAHLLNDDIRSRVGAIDQTQMLVFAVFLALLVGAKFVVGCCIGVKLHRATQQTSTEQIG
ncbi:hypothetical protein CA13_03370 [Planctomycetes bacterium CA13]|uniref:Uncharacterized protein n=1 Tax=Novipirellula herctigrandis TaxID=2527986 RepID=A0A5C5YVS2_9BACT|nr:hypothetical protein CA13_03370 [Planctomycetes bacterium CA13]